MRLHGLGLAPAPTVAGLHVPGGGFHVKAGVLPLERTYFAAKVNANFPANPSSWGLPTIQGVVALFDAERGTPLAIMDSMEITKLRTAAASAVAAKYLARPDADSIALCGCGLQGEAHLRAIALVRPISRAWVTDADQDHAQRFAARMTRVLGIPVTAVARFAEITRLAGILVTCTTSLVPVLFLDDVAPGTFVAAVGADNPDKHEIDPELMKAATVVTDVTTQAEAMGDLHHAIAASTLTRDDVYAQLGEVVAGLKPARRSPDEAIVFDSTGMALQDVAAAVRIYERAGDSAARITL